MSLFEKVLRLGEGRRLKDLEGKVVDVNAYTEAASALSDSELASKTVEFRQRLTDGETLDDLLPEAFAVVREASGRVLNMRHFDVQIMGGIVLHDGNIAEMKTGEGKTLVATLPVYLNALTGKGVHVVTVNDYLATRDSEWMGQIYKALGLTVGLIRHETSNAERQQAYLCDITYGTNTEFGFDYLRDNMVSTLEERVQSGRYAYAIVDEVDSILIDEARTPLIISGPSDQAANLYYDFARIIPRLKREVDYEIDEKTRTAAITENGVARVEQMLGIDNLYEHVNTQLVNHLNQALRAQTLFRKDVDYIIKDGEIIIVDEFTGRLMFGRRYSEGLHQAIEAKENVKIREENQTLATITLQNYFRMYAKLAGMTGTAATEADEFSHIYKLDTVIIPTNQQMIRDDLSDVIYKTEKSKFNAVVEEIIERHNKGQPVLVGTISIEKSETLSDMLSRRGIPHEVLNAKHHEREAEIIALAGQSGAVTIATNMAGRGVDIVLGDKVVDVGGLHILGTERHESRRIDNQLRGRAGRQGDPGSSQFYLSLEDDLMRMFGAERIAAMMDRLHLPDDQPIEHGLISRTIETAQKQVESQNFNARKHVLEYDDVMNKQREVIYDQRLKLLSGDDLYEQTEQMVVEAIERLVDMFTSPDSFSEEWDVSGLMARIKGIFPSQLDEATVRSQVSSPFELKDMLGEEGKMLLSAREQEMGADLFRHLQRMIMLQVVDNKWRDHLLEMDHLRSGIGLRAIGQRDPLVEYKTEAFNMFQEMVEGIKEDYLTYIYHVQVVEEEPAPRPRPRSIRESSAKTEEKKQEPIHSEKIGRNAPCPCGSGKKFKKCCGA